MNVTLAVGLGRFGDSLVAAVDSPGFAPSALAVAVGAGALHALAPGHGKTLTAGYLIAARGRRRDAVLLGAAVALMHTLSVLAVALTWMLLSAGGAVDLGPVSSGLRVAAGAMVVVAGALLVRHHRLRYHRLRHHSHGHGHHHSHGAERPGLVLIAASGGLLPSPSALLVLLTGLFSGRSVLALALVASFGIGMALVLAGIGLATVSGRDIVSRAVPAGMPARIAIVGPTVVAWGIMTAGCLLTAAAIVAA